MAGAGFAIDSETKGSSGLKVADLAGAFLAAVFLTAAFLAVAFFATALVAVLVAAFLVTRLVAGGAASALAEVGGAGSWSVVLLIRNRFKG